MNKTEHLLTCLSEECAEIQQAVSKAVRFGLDDGHPESNTTNAQDIERELTDLAAVIELLEEDGLITIKMPEQDIKQKKDKVCKYMEYAKQRGTIT